MFIGIENLYKKEGEFNKIFRKSTIIYLTIIIIIIICITIFFKFFAYKSLLFLPFLFIFSYLLMIGLIIKNFKLKLTFSLKENKKKILKRLENIKIKEIKLIKKWLIDNNCYNIECVKIYMQHYSKLNIKTNNGGNFWTIISILIGIMLAIVNQPNEQITNLIIQYVIIIITLGIFIEFSYSQILDIKKVIKGEDQLYENLEEIFFQIYIDLLDNKNTNKKRNEQYKKVK